MVKHYWNRYEKVVEFAPPQKKNIVATLMMHLMFKI